MQGKSAITLNELKNQVLMGGEFEIETSGFLTNDRLKYLLNVSLSELHDLLADVFEDYFVATKQFAVYDTGTSMLPSNFQRCLKMLYVYGDDRIPIEKFSIDDVGKYVDSNVYLFQNYCNYNYRILGENVHFLPKPPTGTVFELWYVPRFQYLEDWADTIHISVPIMWSDYCVNDVIATILAKEESDPTFFLSKKAEAKARIVAAASNRDAGKPDSIVDVTSGSYDLLP